jgi:hypothetical protein
LLKEDKEASMLADHPVFPLLVGVDPVGLAGGAEATLSIPTGSAPSFDGAGSVVRYVVRA